MSRPLCSICHVRPVADGQGSTRYRKRCTECIRAARAIRLNKNRDWVLKHKKDRCEECGFKAEHPCQLDVDHIDGNRFNPDPSNFRTLCANCHRLKTLINGDHLFGKTYAILDDSQTNLVF